MLRHRISIIQTTLFVSCGSVSSAPFDQSLRVGGSLAKSHGFRRILLSRIRHRLQNVLQRRELSRRLQPLDFGFEIGWSQFFLTRCRGSVDALTGCVGRGAAEYTEMPVALELTLD